ncbi:AcvB/VirJ family lysyl-phosphatidylglycerol hydrolase [Gemmatimonas groenlandica]|uniref:Glycosyltransferase n=1 Tax=Gemmatimonas groenlandica TaxID=2732249 RepID=A0A6M4IS26_9BACT|nr:AcvB/VirJ family lysyl-phosphatidylglycerol hydrolase [Gemmatimonas groenlandica]QJR37430.1 glycosyltransferase [Gemmatimonas groenlandica]
MSRLDTTVRRPVFLDPTGRRWRRVRGVIALSGVVTTLLVGYLLVGILAPPLLPGWVAPRALVKPHAVDARARRRLFSRLSRTDAATGTRRDVATALLKSTARATPLRAAFFVNWDDDAYQSLSHHAGDLDWVITEWGFLRTNDLALQWRTDPRVLPLVRRLPAAQQPRVLAMITNVDSGGRAFSGQRVSHLLHDAAARTRFVNDAVAFVDTNHLGGIVLDLELVPSRETPAIGALLRALRARLHRTGAVVAVTAAADADATTLRQYGADADVVIAMLYDEHSDRDDPGPVASQPWFTATAERVLTLVPAAKVMLAFGAFGYAWNDAVPAQPAEAVTYAEALAAARHHGVRPQWDRQALEPVISWTDADSTDHVLWYLDATTNWNAMQRTTSLGAAGAALWRLGAEDPAIWRVFGKHVHQEAWEELGVQPPGYGVDMQGDGELLRVTSHPTAGTRALTHDSLSGLITDVRTLSMPQPWTVERTGAAHPHRVALTFDDGPDGDWTPAILDTLRSRHATAAFFVIGDQVQSHLAITRRIAAEGHEIGSHTFSHPDLSRVSPFGTRLELDATARLLEAVVGRRSLLFRPPYFGDAEPTTIDELAPVEIATSLGYLTTGVHIDSDDWRRPGVAAIVARTLAQRSRGNVILLHDGGGDRAQTVAAIGPLIDSLRARGDTIGSIGALVDAPASVMMPPLTPDAARRRWIAFTGYAVVGSVEWCIGALFTVAVTLGVARLLLICLLALRERFAPKHATMDARRLAVDATPYAPSFSPSVSVLVPAHNEQAVVVETVRSLLAQRYDGLLDVIVIDDGSLDDTYALTRNTFAGDERVLVLTKRNGGKASALNHGMTRARGEILVGLDADTVFEPDTIARLVAPLADVRVGAVAGNAKVGNRINLVTRWQAIEYITSQNLERRAFAALNAITVVPGAVGAWRATAVRDAGGFSEDTLAEDQDLTIALRRRGWRIAFADDAIAWTEAPDTLRLLARQRFRWCFGTLQCAWKHRDTLLRPRYGTLGTIAMLNTWVFQLCLTALSPLADLLFLFSLLSVGMIVRTHGATYGRADLQHLLSVYAVFNVVDIGVAMLALLMERGEDRRLAWLVVLQRFAYRQVMYWVVLRSVLAAFRGRLVGWGTLERKATVSAATLTASLTAAVGGALVAAGVLSIVPRTLTAQSAKSDQQIIASLPITEVPATSGNTLAIFWTGDGGWQELVSETARHLAQRGVAVVGINSRSWLTSGTRTPQDASVATAALIRHYTATWGRERVLLLGYSRGAGFAPFIYNRLPVELQARVELVGMLGMEPTASFEFHLIDLVRSVSRPTDLPARPELDRIRHPAMLCMYGQHEAGTLCPSLDTNRYTVRERPGDHHFDRDYGAIADQILAARPP